MRNLLSLVAFSVLFVVSCSPSTRLVESWRDPNTTLEKGHFKKMLCIALVKDESNRRVAEDKLASLMPGRAVPSYTYLGALPDTLDARRTAERLAADGFDGILIMRLARKQQDVSYVPGAYPDPYYSAWGYYGYAMPYYGDPGYVRTDDYYYIETNLYDVAKDKLVWSGTTSSWEPSNVSRLVEEVVHAVYEKMKSEGFVAATPKE